jgi:hypothetical protein
MRRDAVAERGGAVAMDLDQEIPRLVAPVGRDEEPGDGFADRFLIEKLHELPVPGSDPTRAPGSDPGGGVEVRPWDGSR